MSTTSATSPHLWVLLCQVCQDKDASFGLAMHTTIHHIMYFSEEAIAVMGAKVVTHGTSSETGVLDERTFVAFYGCSPSRLLDIWETCERPSKNIKHLFWTLAYMKLYLP